VGVTSMTAVRATGHSPIYSSTKAFMSVYMEGLRYHCRQKGIKNLHITEIRPGFVQTEMADKHNDPSETFWVASAETVARQIIVSVRKKKRVAYVTRRWWLISWVMKYMPSWVYGRFV